LSLRGAEYLDKSKTIKLLLDMVLERKNNGEINENESEIKIKTNLNSTNG